MSTTRETAYSIFGVYRLARLDRSGMTYLDTTPEGALRSFRAALIVLPGYVVLVLLRLWEYLGGVSLPRFVVVQTLDYIVTWTAFAFLMYHVSRMLDRDTEYPAFLCAYNWSQVILVGLFVPILLISRFAFLPPGVGGGLLLIANMLILIYQWFIARTALNIGGGAAAGIVVLDMVISVVITVVSDSMIIPPDSVPQ